MLSNVSWILDKLKLSPSETLTDLLYIADETPSTRELIETLLTLNKGPS